MTEKLTGVSNSTTLQSKDSSKVREIIDDWQHQLADLSYQWKVCLAFPFYLDIHGKFSGNSLYCLLDVLAESLHCLPDLPMSPTKDAQHM